MNAFRAAIVLRIVLVATYLALSQWVPYSDIVFYHQVAERSAQGQLPYFHFWMEYPPVFPLAITGLYQLLAFAGLREAGYFYLAVALILSVADLVNLMFVHHLVERVHGKRRAGYAALIYAGMPFLIWYALGWFDGLAVLPLLAGLAALMAGRGASAGSLTALGALTKIFPATLLVAAPLVLRGRVLQRFIVGLGGTALLILAPLALAPSDLVVASLASLVLREPWETVWALLAGNYRWGVMPGLDQRLTAASAYAAAPSPGGPISLLVQIALAGVAVWAAFVIARSGRQDGRLVYIVVAIAVAGLLLGSKGFSPQFVTWLVPLILLVWPNPIGLAYVMALAVYVVLTYSPLYQVIGIPLHVSVVVLLRTGVLLLLFANLVRLVQRATSARPSGAALRSTVGPFLVLTH